MHSKLTIIGSNNDLSPGHCQALSEPLLEFLLLFRILELNPTEILNDMDNFVLASVY